ncbi:MAG: 3-isopropylmalate dehydratase small subunit [Proteobacteria bacterium]|nr:3-isopropylmalate dehydratase small subunit [Pseudomonadota bacterium]
MEAFTELTAVAVPFDQANIDTNQLCPTRFNKVPPGSPGYERILFHDLRFEADGSEKADFILNRDPYRAAGIIVADANFGCGSARESAAYALLAFGVRCLVAPSFGDIFYNNCLKTGVLPVPVTAEISQRWRRDLRDRPGATITVDLEAQMVTAPDGTTQAFDIPPTRKMCLLQGLDDIALTERYRDDIETFEAAWRAEAPWLDPGNREGV